MSSVLARQGPIWPVVRQYRIQIGQDDLEFRGEVLRELTQTAFETV
jgi:hypothetical protein